MPTVTLKAPLNRLFIHDTMFERDVPVDAPYAVARAMTTDPRVVVDMKSGAQRQEAGADIGDEPEDEVMTPMARQEAIIAAIAELDLDDESNWLADGRPDARVLGAAVGFAVTSAERDTAMKAKDKVATPKPGMRIIKRAKPADTALLDTGAGDVEV